jgi:hypothetical protein
VSIIASLERFVVTSHAAAPAVGSLAATAGLVIIWAARASVNHPIYVSELGAVGMPTARPFAIAFIVIAVGGALVALGSRSLHARIRLLDTWPPAVTIGVASVCFVVASQVTCSYGCPVPLANPRSTPGDLIHTLFAVLGFTLACFAMLQVAFAHGHRALSRVSLLACALVAAITIVGGILAILHLVTTMGALFEFIGASVAVGWLVLYGLWLSVERLSVERLRQARPVASSASS